MPVGTGLRGGPHHLAVAPDLSGDGLQTFAGNRLASRLGSRTHSPVKLDPIRPDAGSARAWDRITRSSAPSGGLLMDQGVFAGVGNIYRAEVLFRHGMNPYRPGRDVSAEAFADIWADLVDLMTSRLAPGGALHVATDWEPYAEQMLAVLDAQPGLRNAYSPWAPRLERPLTKFERTGLEKGHEVRDLVYVRV